MPPGRAKGPQTAGRGTLPGKHVFEATAVSPLLSPAGSHSPKPGTTFSPQPPSSVRAVVAGAAEKRGGGALWQGAWSLAERGGAGLGRAAASRLLGTLGCNRPSWVRQPGFWGGIFRYGFWVAECLGQQHCLQCHYKLKRSNPGGELTVYFSICYWSFVNPYGLLFLPVLWKDLFPISASGGAFWLLHAMELILMSF